MDCSPDGKPSKNESYFLLSDCISEDKTLRDEIYRVKLVMFLIMQQVKMLHVIYIKLHYISIWIFSRNGH